MIICVDSDGQKAVHGMCDIVLKTGGLSNLNFVGQVLSSLQIIDLTKEQLKEKDNGEHTEDRKCVVGD